MGSIHRGGRAEQGSGWEVFQGYRMVLKGYVSVGLGQVPGVTGLGEEAQVGEVEPSNYFPLFSQPWSCNLFLVKRMRSQRCQENDIGENINKENGRFPHNKTNVSESVSKDNKRYRVYTGLISLLTLAVIIFSPLPLTLPLFSAP